MPLTDQEKSEPEDRPFKGQAQVRGNLDLLVEMDEPLELMIELQRIAAKRGFNGDAWWLIAKNADATIAWLNKHNKPNAPDQRSLPFDELIASLVTQIELGQPEALLGTLRRIAQRASEHARTYDDKGLRTGPDEAARWEHLAEAIDQANPPKPNQDDAIG